MEHHDSGLTGQCSVCWPIALTPVVSSTAPHSGQMRVAAPGGCDRAEHTCWPGIRRTEPRSEFLPSSTSLMQRRADANDSPCHPHHLDVPSPMSVERLMNGQSFAISTIISTTGLVCFSSENVSSVSPPLSTPTCQAIRQLYDAAPTPGCFRVVFGEARILIHHLGVIPYP